MVNLLATLFVLWGNPAAPGLVQKTGLDGVHRVVFVGDSITYAGQSIEFVEAFLRATDPNFDVEFFNLGLPSETVSGLSEADHAKGAFPRPELRERFARVLDQTKPDLVVACYGMNDGIYYPLSEDRFKAFRSGIIELRESALKHQARLILLTPPVFDAKPIAKRTLPSGLAEYRLPFEGYDDVLQHYSDWLIEQKAQGWDVIDIHGPIKADLIKNREQDADYRLADDGVHLNEKGHWIIAKVLLKAWGADTTKLGEDAENPAQVFDKLTNGRQILDLVQARQRIVKDAWLTSTGHKRPGMSRGKALPDAEVESKEIEEKLRTLQKPKN